jgi:signal peptidase I
MDIKNSISKFLKKFWFILWKDDSLKGWIFSVIFLAILIKFIFLPLLGVVTGTSLPLAIVESCSMYHQGNILTNLDSWINRHETKYESLGITKEEFETFPFKSGFSKADILFITGVSPDKIKIGDIILFNSGSKGTPIIHRVINIRQENSEFIFTTIGDNNAASFSLNQSALVNPYRIDEINVKQEQIVGKARFRILPYVGWVKLIFYEHLQPPSNKGFCKEN